MQNREAQRLFRERKTRQQEDLLNRIQELERLHEKSRQENCQLKDLAEELKEENAKLQLTLKSIKSDCKTEFNNFEFKAMGPSYLESPYSSPSPISIGDAMSSPSFSQRDVLASPSLSAISDSKSPLSVGMRDFRSSSIMSTEEFDRDTSVELKKLASTSPVLSFSQMNLNSTAINSPLEKAMPNTTEFDPSNVASITLPSLDSIAVAPVDAETAIKEEARDPCNLQSSVLNANPNNDNISVEYVDLLVEELHQLCKEMKQKAMVSSEPFEFEWPCDEIDNRLNEVNSLG
ncbi:DNA-binding transcription factor yap1, variant 2 [Basidiobolus ranarum]